MHLLKLNILSGKSALPFFSGIIVTIVGLIVLVGWQMDITFLKTFGLGAVTMKPNVAALFLLSGLTLLLLQFSHQAATWLSRFCSFLIVLVGILTLIEFVFNLNFGIDEVLFRVPDITGLLVYPSRIAANAALNFVLLGIVLYFFSLPGKRKLLFIEFCLITAFAISLVGLLGLVFWISDLSGSAGYKSMAIISAVSFMVLSLGIYFTYRKYMAEKITVEQKLFAGLTIIATIILFIVLLSLYDIKSMRKAEDWVEHTQIVKEEIGSVLNDAIIVETGARGFIITGDDTYLEPLEKAKNDLPVLLKELHNLTPDNLFQQNKLNVIESLIEKQIKIDSQLIEARKTKGLSEALIFFNLGRDKTITDSIRAITEQMIVEENRLLLARGIAEENLSMQIGTVVKIGFLFQVFLLALIYFFVKKDITGRRKAENILSESEKKFKNVFENSPIGKSLTTIGGKLTVNKEFCKITGYSKEELSQLHWKKISHPDEIEETQNLIISMLAGEINNARLQRRYIHKLGKVVWIDFSTFLQRDSNGKPQFFITSVNDITKQKEAEEALLQLNNELEERINKRTADLQLSEKKYRNLVDNAIVGVYSTTLDGEFLFANNALVHIIEAGSLDQILSSPVSSYYKNKEDRVRFIQQLRETGKVPGIELELVTKKSNPVTVILSAILQNNIISGMMVDISERKEAEKEIKLLAHSIASIQECVTITDTNDFILFANDAFFKTYGYHKEELIGKHISILRPRDVSLEIGNKILNKTIEGGWAGETINQKKDGTLFPVYLSTSVIKDDRGNGIALIGVVMDITERKKAEEKMLQVEKRFRSLIEQGKDIITLIDKNGIITYTSPSNENILGYTNEEYLGTGSLGYIHPQDLGNIKKFYSDIYSNPGKTLRSEFRFRHKDGTYRWLEAVGTNYFDNPNLKAIVSTARDITQRKQEENRKQGQRDILASIIKSTPLNEIFELIIKSVEREEMGWLCSILLLDEDGKHLQSGAAPSLPDFYNQAIDGLEIGEKVGSCGAAAYLKKRVIAEDLLTHPNWIPFRELTQRAGLRSCWSEPILGDEGKVLGTFAMYNREPHTPQNEEIELLKSVVDIASLAITKNLNERHIQNIYAELETKVEERTAQLAKTNEELQLSKIEAEQANLAKSEFLSRMSHELRTPMNSILGFAQLMDLGELIPSHKKGVNQILKSGKHLLDLINEVLDLSRIESGKLSISLEPVALKGIISETMDFIHPLADKREINIELIDRPVNGLFVKADRQGLKQVLLNLINNAVKFNREKGSVTIECIKIQDSSLKLGTDQSEPETLNLKPETKIRISIIDTGKGIATKELHNLFKPFQRIGSEISEIEGTGLGLAVAKKLVEAMDGSIGVESTPGVGSTFWIELQQAAGQVDYHKQNGGLTKYANVGAQKKGTILYIEDNQSNIELVEQILGIYHPEIFLLTEKYGKLAVKHASEYKPDLILLDLDLPDIHGSKVIKFLKSEQTTKDIPVIIISADSMPKQINKLLKAGAKNYLTKPIDVIQFLKIVDEYVDK